MRCNEVPAARRSERTERPVNQMVYAISPLLEPINRQQEVPFVIKIGR